jgi:ketosteroid isomerase-like protein
LYIARYLLTYPDGKTASGPTTLVFAREAGGWHIIADHSS